MNTTGKIQELTSRDNFWEEVMELDQKYFPRPWKKNDWESLDLSQHGLWVITDQNQAIGFALFSTPQDETAHLLKILIIPEHRGSGRAQLFWKHISEALRSRGFLRVYLEVEESNARAMRLYQKLGFHLLRRVKSYYSDGETGVMMQLTL
jgi:ribosomal-protein-alanine N-acetyltransferase